MEIIKEYNKFRDSRNRLTFAGLACGYIDTVRTPEYHIQLDMEHGVIEVSIYVNYKGIDLPCYREFIPFQQRRADAYKCYRAKCREFAKQFPKQKPRR